MGKTYRRTADNDYTSRPKQYPHSRDKRSNGLNVNVAFFDDDIENIVDDEVNIRDGIVINKKRDAKP